MNTLGLSLLWTTLQVTLFCLAGGCLHLAARRRHPTWGAAVLCGALLTTVGIASLSFSPWPRWWTLAIAPQLTGGSEATNIAATPRVGQPLSVTQLSTSDTANEIPSEAGNPQANLGFANFFSGIWRTVHRQLDETTSADRTTPGWQWPAWLAAAVLAGIGLGLARVLLGIVALRRLLRETRRVADPELAYLLDELRVQLDCRRPIELREMTDSTAGGSPAVVGWRRPVILLPADWRRWSTATRRVILAHETAHVAHGDFLMWLVAQLGVILHFYNPLVHWLAHRLRIEQELAADVCGAALAGGPKSYVTVLAQMALAQDEARPLWAGRPFFPTRGTLIRRIEMLHNQRNIRLRPSSGAWPAAMLLALALIGLAVSGMRGPMRAARAADRPAEKTVAEKTAAAGATQKVNDRLLPAFDSSYIPAETIAVMSIKPLKVANSKVTIQPTFLQFPNAFGIGFGTSNLAKDDPWEIEELKAVVLKAAPDAAAEPPAVFIYRMRQPFDQSKIRVKIFGEPPDGVTELTLHGHKCYRAISEVSGDVVNYLLADDRTVVVVREKDMAPVLAADTTAHPAWYAQWLEAAGSPIAFGFDSAAMVAVMTAAEAVQVDPAEQLFESIVKETSLVFGHVASTPQGLVISASAHCPSSEKAVATNKLLHGLLELGRQALPALADPAQLPREFQGLDIKGSLLATLTNLTTTVNAPTKQVRAEARIDADFIAKLADAAEALLVRDTEELTAQAKEHDKAHVEKLDRLIEAMSVYHSEHGHFPPATVIGPDGKTPHSWRVELLPLLGQQELFDSYKLDEPWDSEHNRQLIEKIPSIYSSSESLRKGDTAYFVVTGKGTLFDGAAPSRRDNVTDAAGETIVVLQSRRQIPWTRPVDIDLSADAGQLNLGRSRGNGFYAAFVDGTVRLVPKKTDPATMRALFTIAAGDEVKLK